MALSTRHPIALLPVRIETRFADASLLVRIFPDTLHADGHEPRLADDERVAREAWLASARDLEAWRRLVAAVGAARASYLVTPVVAEPRPRPWAEARLLPARWQVVITPHDAAGVPGEPIRVATDAIVRPLALAPDPGAPGDIADDRIVLGGDAGWLTSFDEARARGMALVVPLGAAAAAASYTVLVFGVPDDADDEAATAGAAELAEVLAAHRFTDGLGVLATGTPTNHTAEGAPPWSSDEPDAVSRFERATGPEATAATTAAAWLGDALGIGAAPLARADAAELDHGAIDGDAAAMQALLWPATLGYFLEQMVDGALPRDPALIERLRRLFVGDVRNRGPLPTLRIGRNPYGVLPVTSLAAWQPRDGEDLDAGTVAVLRGLLATWRRSAAAVPRVGADGDRVEALAQILGQEPVSTSYVARSVLGAAYTAYLYDFIRKPLGAAWWSRQSAIAERGWSASGLPPAAHRLRRAVFADEHVAIAAPAVAATPTDEPLPYLTALLAASLAQLRTTEAGPGAPLLQRLARQALLGGYLASARRLLAARGEPGPFVDPEMIGLKVGPSRTPVPPPWTWLDRTFDGAETIGAALDRLRTAAPDPAFAATWEGLARVANLPGARVDALFREALDLCAHRIDAWATAVATRRLRTLRTAASTGVLIGGYAWVEHLRRDALIAAEPVPGEDGPLLASSRPGGFIHAPTPAHAVTAALLRSGYLAHQGGDTAAFAIDLSSARARLAAEVLESVRAGLALGAVLGRRFERALTEHPTPRLGHLVIPLRRHVTRDPARVVDGHALLTDRATIPWGSHELPAAGTEAHTAVVRLLDELAEVLDATADLIVAESVHQVALGNPLRAGRAVDAIAFGEAPPSELQILEHRGRGVGLEHRVLALVSAEAGAATGWAITPRALGEPALEAWSAALLGPAARYHARAVFRTAAGDAVLGVVELTLADLGIGALDAVYGADELAARALDHAARARPADAGPDATVALERVSDGLDLDDAAILASAVHRTIAAGRAARATDLGVTDEPAPAPGDLDELTGRLPDAILDEALGRLAADPRDGLLAAAGLGVTGAVPDVDPARWPAQVASARAELQARQGRLPGADPVARLAILLGDGFRVTPRFRLPAGSPGDQLAAQLAAQPALVGDDASTPATWLGQIAGVREPVAALERALFLSDTFTPVDDAALSLRVAQLPHAGEPWIGRAIFARGPDDAPPSARTSFVLHTPHAIGFDGPLAGLAIDAFAEVVPDARTSTGLAFQYDQPGAQAPQAILLAVPADDAPTWTVPAVEAIVREAIELVHARAVDVDLLREAGHYLPALYVALNLAGDTAATNFFPEGSPG